MYWPRWGINCLLIEIYSHYCNTTTKKLDFCHENLRRKNFHRKFATNFPTKSKICWKLAMKNFSSQNSLEICNEKFFRRKIRWKLATKKIFVVKFVGNQQRKNFRRKIRWKFPTNSKKPGIVRHFLNSLEIFNEFQFSGQFVQFSLQNSREISHEFCHEFKKTRYCLAFFKFVGNFQRILVFRAIFQSVQFSLENSWEISHEFCHEFKKTLYCSAFFKFVGNFQRI